MLQLPSISAPVFDDTLLQSIDWLESFPWKENAVKTEKDKYEICLQVHHYVPDEVSVKIVDGFIVVEAKHDERRDNFGFISRKFVRRFQIPEGCQADKIKSRMTSDGYLIITVPRTIVKHDIVIPVKHESQKSKSKL